MRKIGKKNNNVFAVVKKSICLTFAVSCLFVGSNVVYAENVTKTSEYRNITASAVTSDTYISESEAKKIALDYVKLTEDKVTFTKVKIDYDDGIKEYELKFTTDTTKYELEINAANGQIMEFSQKSIVKRAKSSKSELKAMSDTYISESEAKKIALDHAKLSEDKVIFTKAKIDYDDGAAEYEIEFIYNSREYEYEIDAVSGKILECEID